MTLSLRIELIDILTIVNFLRVDFYISCNHTLPNRFRRFFEVDIKWLLILYIPERVINFNFFTEFTIDYGFFLAFDLDF